MTDQQHLIAPPPELRQLWAQQAQRMDPRDPVAWQEHVATQAAQWGSDQELDACCEWFVRDWTDIETADMLRAARRPKSPSLKEQALAELDATERCYPADYSTIRRALEALPE